MAIFLPFLQERPLWEKSQRRTHPVELAPSTATPQKLLIYGKKEQDSCSPELQMPALGFQKPHRILSYTSPEVSPKRIN